MASTRSILIGLAATSALAITGAAHAQPSDELVAEAQEGGTVLWYESSQAEQAAQIIDAFNESYPDIVVEHVRVTGGNGLGATIIQEAQAGAETASLATGGVSHLGALLERDLLAEVPEGANIDERLMQGDHLVNTAASVYVAVWNTDAVAEGDEPTSWEDFLEDQWQGRIGTWVISAGFSNLAAEYGEEETRALVEQFAAQEPLLYRSTYPLAQQVAAGEVDVAMGIYHTAQPPIQAGAPIEVGALDPTPMNTIWSGIVNAGDNQAGAAVLMSWLVSPEGAIAYENATNRGNAIVEGTNTSALLEGATLSEWSYEQTDSYRGLMEEFNETLATGGTSVE
jgi:ABC-type Fe3+ transport system substrate-binding protein